MRDDRSPTFRRSSYCGDNHCVEFAVLKGRRVAVRDSKRLEVEPVTFGTDHWATFVRAISTREF